MVLLRALGDVALYIDGTLVRLATRKQTALLVFLAAHVGKLVRREHLASLLWPDSPPDRGRRSLNQALYSIRKRIPTFLPHVDNDGLRLPVGIIQADFLEFQRAYAEHRFDTAAELYRGDFLEGFSIPNAREFEEWQEEERRSRQQEAFQAFAQVMQDAERAGHWYNVEKAALRLLKIDPFSEQVHQSRIQAIAASGNWIRANHVWHQTSEMYRRELGQVPTKLKKTLTSLFSASLSSVSLADVGHDALSARFVGREASFRVIRNEWEKVKAGKGALVIISGEAGIGKTRFCNQFLRLAAVQGAKCFDGKCYATERQIPYSAIVDALGESVSLSDLASLPEQWKRLLGMYLPQFVPETDGVGIEIEYENIGRAFIEAVVQFVRHIAVQQPVVLFIDDFQWSDESTVALVHHLGSRLHDVPVMLLVALRKEEVSGGPALRRFISEPSPTGGYREIVLSELMDVEARELIEDFARRQQIEISETLQNRLLNRVGGRPFFIIEYLRAYKRNPSVLELREKTDLRGSALSLPESIESYLALRFSGLGDIEVQIVGTISVLGRAAPLDLLHRVSGVEDTEIMNALANLVERGIVSDTPEGLAFTHDLLREAAYRWIGGPRRRVLHGRVAETLEKSAAAPPGTLALHYELAGNRPKAFTYALAAASASERVHSVIEAESFLRMALANAGSDSARLEVHHRLAHLLYRSRRYGEAEEHFSKLEERYRVDRDRQGLLIAEVNRIGAAVRQGMLPAEEWVQRLQHSAIDAEQFGDPTITCTILRQLGVAAHSVGRQSVALSVAGKLLEYGNQLTQTREVVRNLCIAANILGMYDSVSIGLETSSRAFELVQSVTDPEVRLGVLRCRANNRYQAGLLQLAQDDCKTAAEIVQRIGTYSSWVDLWITGAVINVESGSYTEAEALLTDPAVFTYTGRATHDHLIANANLMVLEFERGDLDRARALAERILDWNRTVSVWWCNITAWGVLGHYALVRGDFAEANRCRRELMLLYEGRDFLVLDVSYAEGFLARLTTIDGDADKALERLDRAIAAYEGRDVFCRSRLQLERARVLLELDVAETRLQAEEVKAFGERIGARPLVRKAEDVLALT